MSAMSSQLRLAFYGDDFTGSTDVLEVLTRAGLRTVLFVDPPTPEKLRAFGQLDAVGVAGVTRSLGPALMASHLRHALPALRALGAPHVHYKVCSTFDSSPAVGSIGCAIDVGAEVFGARFVPVVVGAPALGRYCVFGNLFARMGIGSEGAIHRLDRHPSMSRHPVTPADESDLRQHLGRQTQRRIGLVDVLQLAKPPAETERALAAQLTAGAEIVLFDGLTAEHLSRIGALLDARASRAAPLFSVGSSGVESALTAVWREQGQLPPSPIWRGASRAAPLLVVSGSCSPVTAGQIDWAAANGFATVALAANDALDGLPAAFGAALQETSEHLRAGRNVVLHSSRGETDARVLALPAEERGRLGAALGGIAREAIAATRIRRLLVAGGDTSSYAAATLGIEALEMIAPLGPGAPLCRAHAPGSPVDGLEVVFKGGQVGAVDYFGAVAAGRLSAPARATT